VNLRKLFQRGQKGYRDPHGIYFYVQCDNCGEKLCVRADKRHDLVRDYETGDLTWKKEIMDGRCFRIMYAQVLFDSRYRVQSQEIKGQGHFLTKEEFLS
jgi:hypothetical protein